MCSTIQGSETYLSSFAPRLRYIKPGGKVNWEEGSSRPSLCTTEYTSWTQHSHTASWVTGTQLAGSPYFLCANRLVSGACIPQGLQHSPEPFIWPEKQSWGGGPLGKPQKYTHGFLLAHPWDHCQWWGKGGQSPFLHTHHIHNRNQ